MQPSVAHLYKSGQPNDLHGNMCFEILGFDIMFDSELKPYLIEVNHAPSFNTDSKLDLLIKKNVLTDTFSMLYLVGPKGKSVYKKKCNSDKEWRIYHKEKPDRELQAEQKRAHFARKDIYMKRNCGGYKMIYPPEDQDDLEH